MLNIQSVFTKINLVWLLVPLMGIYGCTPIYTTTAPSTIDTTVGDRTMMDPYYNRGMDSGMGYTHSGMGYTYSGMGYTHHIPFPLFIYHDDVRDQAVLHRRKVQSRTTRRKVQKVQKAQSRYANRYAKKRKPATQPPQSNPKPVPHSAIETGQSDWSSPTNGAPYVNRKVVPYRASPQPARKAQPAIRIAPQRAEPRRAVKRTPHQTENRKQSQPAKRSAKRRQAQRRN